jgi:hypothetical protein
MADVWGRLGNPKDMVWDHPAVGQIYIVFELHRDHFGVNLYDNPLQPIADALLVPVVITEHINVITYLEGFITIWCFGKM